MPPQRPSTGHAALDRRIGELLAACGSLPHPDLIRRMLVSVILMAHDEKRADLKIIASSLEELERSFNILEKYHESRKVALFGSARTGPDNPIYIQARDFARRMEQLGYMVITGAGGGVMQAGNEGAGRARSFGMNISLPFEQLANPFIAGDEKLLNFRYFFTRKLSFLKDTHAVVLCPGGYGTHDEGFETLTLVQTGKAQLLPVIFLHPAGSGFWDDLHRYVKRHLLGSGLISPEDLSLYMITEDIEAACGEIERFYRCYHSMRLAGPDLVIRLECPLTDEHLACLQEEYSDIVNGGRIERSGPLPEEEADPRLSRLPRIKFPFRRHRYGRLRQMIDRINGFVEVPEIAPTAPERGEGGRMPAEADPGRRGGSPPAPPTPEAQWR
ncbi:MAG: LOG family protein [Armatimonadetes bacterium]|nr:LOG family protein [Armatimonadota bacterium]